MFCASSNNFLSGKKSLISLRFKLMFYYIGLHVFQVTFLFKEFLLMCTNIIFEFCSGCSNSYFVLMGCLGITLNYLYLHLYYM